MSTYRKCYHHHTLSAARCLKTLVRASSCSITVILIDTVSGVTAIVNLHFVGDFWGHKCLSCVTLCETSAQTLLCFPLGQRKRQKNETLNSSIRLHFQCPYLFIVLMNTAWAHSLHRSWKPEEAEMFIDLSALHTYSPLDWEYITHKYLCVYSWRQDVLVVLGSTPSAKSTFMLFCSYIVLLIFMDKYWNEIDVLFGFSFGSHMSFSSGFTFSDPCSGNNSIQCRELQHN